MGTEERIRIGISSCLLGEKVRFDANHKRDAYITGTLARFFDFLPLCPEVAIGMGVPRPTIRLEGDPERPRLVGVREPGLDVTEAMEAFSREQARTLPPLAGYILKSKSPSCGMERVKIHTGRDGLAGSGAGLFARALMAARPELPVEEEGRLGDPGLRDNFLERVFAYHRWQRLIASGVTRARIIDFHSTHKLSLMAHGADHYRRLGRQVARMADEPLEPFAEEYIRGFMQTLRYKATNKKQANVLQHLMGYLKHQIDREDKQELIELIDAYRREQIPLVVPLTLLKHHFRRYPDPYIEKQIYLHPEPAEMLLRRGGV